MKLLVKIFLLVSCFAVLQHGSSQNAFPPAYQLTTDTISTVTLPVSNWQYVEDRGAKWTIDSMLQPAFGDKFHTNTPENRRDNDHMLDYWVRFRLKNTMDREAHIALQFLEGSQSDLYLFESNGIKRHLMNGIAIPWSKQEGTKLNIWGGDYIPISILVGDETTIYMKTHSEIAFYSVIPSRMLIHLFSIEKMNSELRDFDDSIFIQAIEDSVFFGILLWVAIFNLFFFSIVKERTYLYFALYVFFLGFGRFHTALFHLFFREQPNIFFPFLFPYCQVFITFFNTYFFRELLKTRLNFPKWDKLLVILNTTFFIAFTLNYFLNYKIFPPKWVCIFAEFTWSILAVILYLSLLVTLILFIRKPERTHRNFMFALLPPFGTWVICFSLMYIFSVLNSWFAIPLPFFLHWLETNWAVIEKVCLAWMIIYFSWVLIERFNELRKQVVQKELEKEIERSQLIEQQKTELEKQVAERTSELNLSLKNLKSTQNQLIQSEKLASLGELTAGIAHEIQNPLNFVNNFAKFSIEIAQDLNTEINQPEVDKKYVGELLKDLTSNQEKINFHGVRASNIVSGMIEHSKPNTGVRELTEVNKLCDEYLRFAKNSFQTKNKDFKCETILHFDDSLPKIEIVPQDIGRVVVNLINNAFYAVNERSKNLLGFENLTGLDDKKYKPVVTVTTQKTDNTIEIRIKDNGTGIPDAVKEKIFQPFFTTKPTGSGTGLGLSLAYDIITKGHGGTLKVESVEGEGSVFIIVLP